ncbi:Z-DNA-binding protein 1 isoform X2 [Elephas maximus indicus]|uniref:Z-DNA-binding protein 1 isoform X2 n=1 Tax=Elephas maximus indicus TaxID=99487 RepID=UPI002116804F|nr:Z-DNA-binding protein 1 isoform X2 [Elephas maximus indicus]
MAETPADPGEKGDLEQKILQVLREAASPVKTVQLVRKCQVSKKELNQVLYRMKAVSTVTLTGPATWCLPGDGTGAVIPSELAEAGPSRGNRPSEEAAQKPLQTAANIPRSLGSPLSEREEAIYRLLAADGPRGALNIAQALGMKTAKDVNPDLYAMRSKHLLSLDQNSKTWAIYRPDSGRKNQSFENIYQQSTVNMIVQTGSSCHISINNSKGIQIGHTNIMQEPTASEERGSTAPPQPPPTAPGDPSMQEAPASAWGSRDIYMLHCKQVQLGHHNKMSLHGTLDESPVYTPTRSPPVSATPSAEASFKQQMPKPGPQSEGDEPQKVHMKRARTPLSAKVTKMTDGSAGLEGNKKDLGELRENEDAGPARSDSDFQGDVGQATPGVITTLNSKMEALTLGSGDATPADDRAPKEGS